MDSVKTSIENKHIWENSDGCWCREQEVRAICDVKGRVFV